MTNDEFKKLSEELKMDICREIAYEYAVFVPKDEPRAISKFKSIVYLSDKKFLENDVLEEADGGQIFPYNVIMEKVEKMVNAYYQEFKLGINVQESLADYGERGEKFKTHFEKCVVESQKNTTESIQQELFRQLLSGNDVKATIKKVGETITRRTNSLNRLIESLAGQMEQFMVLCDYQDKGYTKYRINAIGENCEDCQGIHGKIFNIVDCEIGENFPPFHPNCDCAIEILDNDCNVVYTHQMQNHNNTDMLINLNHPRNELIDPKMFIGPLMNQSNSTRTYIEQNTDIVKWKFNFGTGLGINLKVADIGIEIGGKRYYEYSPGEAVSENMSFSATAQVTDEIQIGTSITGTVDATTREHLPNSGYAGIKLGNLVIGWDNLEESDDIKLSIELEGYLAVGGGVFLEINLSEIIRRLYN